MKRRKGFFDIGVAIGFLFVILVFIMILYPVFNSLLADFTGDEQVKSVLWFIPVIILIGAVAAFIIYIKSGGEKIPQIAGG